MFFFLVTLTQIKGGKGVLGVATRIWFRKRPIDPNGSKTHSKKFEAHLVGFSLSTDKNLPPKTYDRFVPSATPKFMHLVHWIINNEPNAQIKKRNQIEHTTEKELFSHIWVFGCLMDKKCSIWSPKIEEKM